MRARRARQFVGLGACVLLLLGTTPARGANADQFLPELDAYLKLNERTRVYLYGSFTYAQSPPGSGGALSIQDGAVGAHVDYSLMPVFRRQLLDEDWARNRYLWLRVGYNYLRSLGDTETTGGFRENRGVFALNARTRPLAGEIELTARLRVDARDRSGVESQRYRVRVGAERILEVKGQVVVPYAEAEDLYDTRYDSWSQQRYKLGAEVGLNGSWRIEPYFMLTTSSRSEPSTTRALGLVLKFYR
jgi:hypothetical protein